MANSSGDAELTIQLEGSKTIIEDVTTGIYVLASSNSTGNASLTITGGGSLDASGSQSGIQVQSNGGDAALTIQNAEVTADGGTYGVGVTVRAGESSNASLSVEGGSLTATGNDSSGAGIHYQFGSNTGSGTPSLTVSGNTIVRANGGISDSSSADIQIEDGNNSSGGIVFDDGDGTVYGDVTLQENITINEGESLKLDSGASLNAGGHNVIVDGGTVDDSIKNSLGDKVKYAPTITTTNLPNGTVGTSYNQTLAATGSDIITWSIESGGTLPAGLQLENGVITGTPTTEGTSTFTVKAESSYGYDSMELSITISAATSVSVTGVTLNKTSTELTVGQSETLTATVEPSDAANKNVTWSSSAESVATVEDGKVTAVGAGEATITVTTADGSFTDTCEVTVTAPPEPEPEPEPEPTPPPRVPDPNAITIAQPAHGTLSASLPNASVGAVITVTATPDSGYELAYITVNGERIEGSAFTMPDAAVTVSAVFVPAAGGFADLVPGAWYMDAVNYVAAKGLMEGTSAAAFEPEAAMTRAMVWTILARLDGETVSGSSWSGTARAWATANGISDGTDPNGRITREQLVTMLYRFAGEPAVSGGLSAYADAASVSSWAAGAMLWAIQNGIITGTSAATLDPQAAATRAQAAAILMRFAER